MKSNVKSILEAIKRIEPDAVQGQPKTYSDSKFPQWRKHNERLDQNKRWLLYRFSDASHMGDVGNFINTVQAAFYHYDGDASHPDYLRIRDNRMANVNGFLADVLGSGVQYAREIDSKKLSEQELQQVSQIGRDRAIKLAMHQFAHHLLPHCIGIEPSAVHYMRTDQNEPRVGNHKFIADIIDRHLLPKDVNESQLVADTASYINAFIQTKHREMKDRFADIGKARGLNYDHDSADWLDRSLDLAHGVFGHKGAMEYIKARGPVDNSSIPYKPSLQPARDIDSLDSKAHEKYQSNFDAPHEKIRDQYHQAVEAGDVEAIHSASAALRTIRRGKVVNITGERSRSLGVTTINAPPSQPHPSLLQTKDLDTGDYPKATDRRSWVRSKPIKSTLDHVPYGQADQLGLSALQQPVDPVVHGFAATIANRAETKALPSPNPNREYVREPDRSLVNTPPEYQHKDAEIIDPPRFSTADLDSLNPNLLYPKDLSTLSPMERTILKKTSIKGQYTNPNSDVQHVINRASKLKTNIQRAVKVNVDKAKEKLADFDQSVGDPKPVSFNFNHNPVETPAPLHFHNVLGTYGISSAHDFLSGAARFSTMSNRTPEEAKAMVNLLALSPEANKSIKLNSPTGHAAKIWDKVHTTVSNEPELHNDPRGHAALHLSRQAFRYFEKRDIPEKENDQYSLAHIGNIYSDVGNILNPGTGKVHPSLADLGDRLKEKASEYHKSTDLLPISNVVRDVKAAAIRTGRRMDRSEGMENLRGVVSYLSDKHPGAAELAKKFGERVMDSYKDWKGLSEEVQDQYCDMLIEGRKKFDSPWPEEWYGSHANPFGWKPSGDDDFIKTVYGTDSDRGQLGIGVRSKVPSIKELSQHPDASDRVSQHLFSLHKALPPAKDSKTKQASLAVRSALSDRLDHLQSRRETLDYVKQNPADFDKIASIVPDNIGVNKVIALGHAIKDMATDRYNKNDVTHPLIHTNVEHWLDSNFGAQAVTRKIGKVLEKPIQKSMQATNFVVKKAGEEIGNTLRDTGSAIKRAAIGTRPDERRYVAQSTIGRVGSRIVAASKAAPGTALDMLSGPDILAGPGSEETIAKAKETRARQYQNALTKRGLVMDPIDRASHDSTMNSVNRLRTVAGTNAIKKMKKNRERS